MSQLTSQPQSHSSGQPAGQPTGQLSRRRLFAGAGTLGAIAATASLLPAVAPVTVPQVPDKAAPAKGGGYHLSEHVKRYYKTTLV
jgi:hypothetical protein